MYAHTYTNKGILEDLLKGKACRLSVTSRES